MEKHNLKFAHYPSGYPIPLEFKVSPDTTVGQLRAMVEERLASEGHWLMRGFDKWYLQACFGDTVQYLDLTQADANAVVSTVGIADDSVLLLAGPIVEGELPDKGNAQARQAQDKHMELISEVRLLRAQMSSLTKQDQKLPKLALPMLFTMVCLLFIVIALFIAGFVVIVREQGQQMQSIATQSAEIVSNTDKLSERVQSIFSILSSPKHAEKANELLAKHPNHPLKAVWEALNDENTDAAVTLAVVLDQRCGIERRSTLTDGEMQTTLADGTGELLTLNKTRAGVTPLIMAALAGRVDAMKLLIAAGALLEPREYTYDLSALSTAAIVNDPSATELLIDAGAELHSTTYYPLHHAAYHMSDKAIEVLVRKGADKNRYRQGETPVQMFLRREREARDVPREVKESIRRSFGIQ